MTKFVSIGKTFINVEHVLTVTKPDGNDHIWIEMDSGQSIEAEGKYVLHDWGGAAATLRCARKKKKQIISYFDEVDS